MAFLMTATQAVAIAISAIIAYRFSSRQQRIWIVCLGVLLAIPVGYFSGLMIGATIGETTATNTTDQSLRLVGNAFWCSLVGCIGGVYYGRRRVPDSSATPEQAHSQVGQAPIEMKPNVIVRCPNCSQQLRVPEGHLMRIDCKSC